jgi:hypothetical protein
MQDRDGRYVVPDAQTEFNSWVKPNAFKQSVIFQIVNHSSGGVGTSIVSQDDVDRAIADRGFEAA